MGAKGFSERTIGEHRRALARLDQQSNGLALEDAFDTHPTPKSQQCVGIGPESDARDTPARQRHTMRLADELQGFAPLDQEPDVLVRVQQARTSRAAEAYKPARVSEVFLGGHQLPLHLFAHRGVVVEPEHVDGHPAHDGHAGNPQNSGRGHVLGRQRYPHADDCRGECQSEWHEVAHPLPPRCPHPRTHGRHDTLCPSMAQGRIRLVSVVPGAASMARALQDFASQGPGSVTAASDARLRALETLAEVHERLEVLPWAQVVRRGLALCGEHSIPIAQRGLVEAAVGLACAELEPDTPMYRSRTYPGLHARIADTLDELRHAGWDAASLEEASERVEPDLAARLRSLASVERTVSAALARLGRGYGSDEARRAGTVDPEPGAQWERVFLMAGAEATAATAEWVQAVVARGADVTVCVEQDASCGTLFEGARPWVRSLGLEPERIEEGSPLTRALFGESVAGPGGCRVVIETCADVLSEAEWALRGCLEDAADGVPWDKMALLARDLEAYGPLLHASALRLGVPLRMHRRVPLASNALVRLSAQVLSCCASSDVRMWQGLLGSSYLAMDDETRQRLDEALTEAVAAGTRQWDVLAEAAVAAGPGAAWLVLLLRWRAQHVGGREPLAGWVGKVRALFEDIDWPVTVTGSEAPTAERDQWAYTAFLRALAQHASAEQVHAPQALGLAALARRARLVLEHAEAFLPAGPTGVRVVSSAVELGDVASLRVLGMLEGGFPRRRSEDPILYDEHRTALSGLRPGAWPLADSRSVARAERDAFYRACAAPTRLLSFSYPDTDEDRDNVRAFYLEEVERACGGKIDAVPRPRNVWVPPLGARHAPADESLGQALEAPRHRPLPDHLESEAARGAVRSPDRGPFSPRDLREVLDCPFRAFARLRLAARPGSADPWWSSLRRIPAEAQLLLRRDETEARAALEEALAAEVAQMRARAHPFDVAMLTYGGPRVLEEMIAREFHARELWRREEGSLTAPARIGQAGLRGSVPTAGGFDLSGSVDGVSQVGPYRTVHVSRGRRPEGLAEDGTIVDKDLLEIGMLMLLAWQGEGAVAVELDTPSEGRVLYVLPRVNDREVRADVARQFAIVDLGHPRALFDQVKAAMVEGVARLRSGEMDAVPGDACATCRYGELCRRSAEFGDDLSPFEGGA